MPLPAMTVGIVERVHERQALGVADALHLGEGLADVRAVEDDPCAVPETGVDLRAHGGRRHDHGHRDAGGAAGPRVRLAGVPRGERDGAAAAARRRTASRSGSTCRAP